MAGSRNTKRYARALLLNTIRTVFSLYLCVSAPHINTHTDAGLRRVLYIIITLGRMVGVAKTAKNYGISSNIFSTRRKKIVSIFCAIHKVSENHTSAAVPSAPIHKRWQNDRQRVCVFYSFRLLSYISSSFGRLVLVLLLWLLFYFICALNVCMKPKLVIWLAGWVRAMLHYKLHVHFSSFFSFHFFFWSCASLHSC